MRNIILTGMMGCGKSTLAQMLGEQLHRNVVDTDTLVEEKSGITISQIFAQYGEEHMRELETAVCRELSQQENLIIATGGGLPLRQENRDYLRSTGTVFFLNRDPSEIYDTMDKSGRPLAQQGKAAFLQRFSDREPIYRDFAHVTIEDFSTPEHTLAEILQKMEVQP